MLDTVLVLSRHDGTYLSESSREMLTAGRQIASRVIAATFGTPPVEELSRYGADHILVVDSADVEASGADWNDPAVWAALAIAGAEHVHPQAILLASSYLGKEIAAQAAVQLESGVVTDAEALNVADSQLTVTKSVFSGTWATSGEIIRGVPVVALRPTAVTAAEAPGHDLAETEQISITIPQRARRTRVINRAPRVSEGPNLAESQVVVCGGRGTEGDFTQVKELAALLGGAVGATRVACDEGWIERSAQIGQTGETVAPKLYIGLGVSGAVHHTTGMQASERIVAVVDDSEAPIVELADFTVIGDINDVVPQAIAALKEAGL